MIGASALFISLRDEFERFFDEGVLTCVVHKVLIRLSFHFVAKGVKYCLVGGRFIISKDPFH